MATRKSTGRVTKAGATVTPISGGVVNLDLEEAKDGQAGQKVVLFGETWTLTAGPNVFAWTARADAIDPANATDIETAKATMDAVCEWVIKPQRAKFRKALLAQDSLPWPRLNRIVERFAEIVSARPTKRS